uniref:Uncharacterized protein n=1 Tax=Panagrellus redivivus TaxID=6233 RepID=A0A7E4V1S9_PANRE
MDTTRTCYEKHGPHPMAAPSFTARCPQDKITIRLGTQNNGQSDSARKGNAPKTINVILQNKGEETT